MAHDLDLDSSSSTDELNENKGKEAKPIFSRK